MPTATVYWLREWVYSVRVRDIDIRRALHAEMQRLHKGDRDTRVVDELGLCQGVARVDVAVVNGSVHGYEIKSAHDTLARLSGQSDVYSRALDFVTIVVAKNHAQKIRAAVPRWWGIWSAAEREGAIHLKPVRKARPNPSVEPMALAQLLWREEALDALMARGLGHGMRSKPRAALWRRLADALSAEELGGVVREYLKKRGADWRDGAPPA